jgi:uncharacterized protein YdeI (YjbR/CyaY-like superfamily)
VAGTPQDTITPRSRAQWRRWLQKHHDTRDEIWIVFYKRHTKIPSVSYDEAVEESLCFGWIDGQVRRLDDQRHMQRYTPRRPRSAWSALNLRRFARMVDAGLMTEAGRNRGPTADTKVAEQSWRRPDVVPDEVASILKRSPKAWTNLMAMAPSYRKRVVTWLENAKRPETREKRAKKIIAGLERNEKPGTEYRKGE